MVAADSVGPGMLIRHMESGVLVPVDDPRALAEGLEAVLEDDDLQARLAAGGRAAFEADFTESIVVQRYIEFFERLLAEQAT